MEDETRQELEEEFYETIRVVLLAIQALLQVLKDLITFVSANECIEKPIRRSISAKGYDYIHEILKGDPIHFRDIHRMYPDIFQKFCAIIREKTPLQDTRYICVEEMVATFLLTVGQNSRYCVTRERFGRAHSTTSRNFNKVLKALNTIAPDMMAKPGSVVPSKIKESTRFYPYFKECIGAIDGTHILAQVSGRDVTSYRNRHGKISQNVLAACNLDLEFIYILSGWEGSAHDSKLLNDALVRRNGLKVPRGKFFLVDCGFANRRQFLAPFRGVRYHLKDFGGEGRHPENARELFNLRHSSLRNVVERLFGIFKSRFAIFKSAPPFPFKIQAELVLACAGLHNFLRKECRSDEFPIEEDEDDLFDVEDDTDNDDILETQEQQREHANEWRNNLASNMWNDAMNDDNRDG